ncbi:tetratricopeptide repeat protein [Chryseobacterium sp. PMSZPI]|nr:hypothetical protein [Chryseobacterium sp. PMSZPI]
MIRKSDEYRSFYLCAIKIYVVLHSKKLKPMYKYFFLLFIVISTHLTSQINTQLLQNSSWTVVKFGTLDGSRDLSQSGSKTSLWKITGNTLCIYSDPIFMDIKSCLDFKLEKETILTSKNAGYQIEKLTRDSMIVTQRIDGIEDPDKIRKIWLVNRSVIVNDFINKNKAESIVATKDFTPSLKKNIIFEVLDVYSKNGYFHDLKLKGNILIFPKKQKIEIETKEESKKNEASINLFKTTLEKNYHLWDLTGFENFEKIIIPYYFYSNVGKNENNINKVGIKFFDDNDSHDSEDVAVYIKDKKVSDQNFNKGIEALDHKKFDKAIEFFNKAHEYNNTNTDALYNVVSISFAQNNINSACLALKRLKDLQQTEGTKLFNEKCLK